MPIFVVTAPSGTGKTTLIRRLIKEHPSIKVSVSLTTRQQRPGEINGDHYWFMDREKFMTHVQAERMLEWVELFGNNYGTSIDEIERIHRLGCTPLLEIDVQGWMNIRKKIQNATSIFIMPPTFSSLWERLSNRGTENLEVRWRRLRTARQELDLGANYQYFIVNNELEVAYQELKGILIDKKPSILTKNQGLAHSKALITEFDNAEWIKKLKDDMPPHEE